MAPADRLHRRIERSSDAAYDADASDVPEFLLRRRISSAKLLGRVTPVSLECLLQPQGRRPPDVVNIGSLPRGGAPLICTALAAPVIWASYSPSETRLAARFCFRSSVRDLRTATSQ